MKFMNTSEAKHHIEEIKNKYVCSPEVTLDSLAGAIDRLQKAFPRRGHFVMEFIQNADDAKSERMKIDIGQQEIRILNDGLPFSRKDVESICRVGRSSKTADDYVGYLGVGFKSVFLMCECPQIYSGCYRFKFDKRHWPDPSHTPWQVIPLWINEPGAQQITETGYQTVFVLPVSEEMGENAVGKILSEVSPEHLSDRILLFLRNLKEIEINNGVKGTTRKMVKSGNTSTTNNYELYTLEEYENGTMTHRDRWLVFRDICQVPEDVKQDFITKDWEREDVTSREVVVAFKLNDQDYLVEETGTAHIGVFSFLPLKEVPSGLKFLIQADFLTAPGREVIQRDALWNEWLAREVFKLITGKCLQGLLGHEKWKLNASKILHPGEWGHPLFDEHIKTPLRNYLNDNPVLIAEDGTLIKAKEALTIEAGVRELLSKSDLEKLYQGKKILHEECQTALQVEEGPTSVLNFVKDYRAHELMKQKAEAAQVEWFKNLYKKLAEYGHAYLSKELKYEAVILTNQKTLARPSEVYFKPKNLMIPAEIESDFKFVHLQLVDDPRVLEFIEKLGIENLTEEHVQNVLRKGEIRAIAGAWPSLSDSGRIEKIKLCKDLWQRRQIEIKDLGFLTLKTKSGKWLPPAEVVLSKEYKPGHIAEALVEKGLLDLPMEFLSPDLVSGADDREIVKWREFLIELGVDERLNKEKQHLAQRIGIKTALRFEQERQRKARELGESEKRGYDIVSYFPSGERHIEVKGSSEPSPRIPLTKKEFETLQSEQDEYFVYVVEAALTNPRLYVIKGSELLGAVFAFITIESRQWKPLKEEEFQPI